MYHDHLGVFKKIYILFRVVGIFLKLRVGQKKSVVGGDQELLYIGLAYVGDPPVQFCKESND